VVIPGGPDSPEAWAELDDLLDQEWPHEGGFTMGILRAAVDTGYETQVVYSWARRRASHQVMCVKGEQAFNKSQPVSGPTIVDVLEDKRRIRRGARLWKVAVSTFKSETYRWLRLDVPDDGQDYPAGFIHVGQGIDQEWFRQLTAEHLVAVKSKRGFIKYEWDKVRERNEALDCRVYARAAAYALGVDFWPAHRWDRLEAQVAAKNPNGSAVAVSSGAPVAGDAGDDAPSGRPASAGTRRSSAPAKSRRGPVRSTY
jgi:phage terminase large subunit GpA-like protein